MMAFNAPGQRIPQAGGDVISISTDDDNEVQIMDDSDSVEAEQHADQAYRQRTARSNTYNKGNAGLPRAAAVVTVETISLLSQEMPSQCGDGSLPNTAPNSVEGMAHDAPHTDNGMADEDGLAPEGEVDAAVLGSVPSVGGQEPASGEPVSGNAFSTPRAASGPPGVHRRVYQLSTLVGRVAKRGRTSLWSKLSATARALQFSPVGSPDRVNPAAAAGGGRDGHSMEVETPAANLAMALSDEPSPVLDGPAVISSECQDVAMAEGLRLDAAGEDGQLDEGVDGFNEDHEGVMGAEQEVGQGVMEDEQDDEDEGEELSSQQLKHSSAEDQPGTSLTTTTTDSSEGECDEDVGSKEHISEAEQEMEHEVLPVVAQQHDAGPVTARSVAAYAAMKAGLWCVGLGAAWLAYVYATPEDW